MSDETNPEPLLHERTFDPDSTEGRVAAVIQTCYDPEIPVNIVDLGLVYACELTKNEQGQREVFVTMTLTAPGCGMGDIIVEDVRSKIEIIPTVAKVDVELTFEPQWNHHMMTEAARLETGML